jgi:hypothetical protein
MTMPPALRASWTLAIILGVITPALETVRRWGELRNGTVSWPAFLDDYLIGAFLLYGAWRVRRDAGSGRAVLAAAWAFLCGMAYGSFFGQLAALGNPDPSGVSPAIVVGIKGLGLLIGIVGMVLALRSRRDRTDAADHSSAR